MSFIRFGKYVEARLKELDITPAQAAKRMKVDKKTVERIIGADVQDIKATNLYKLARILKWDPVQVYRAFHGKDPYETKECQKKEAIKRAYNEFQDRLSEIDFEENL